MGASKRWHKHKENGRGYNYWVDGRCQLGRYGACVLVPVSCLEMLMKSSPPSVSGCRGWGVTWVSKV